MFGLTFEETLSKIFNDKDHLPTLNWRVMEHLDYIIKYISPEDTHAFIQRHLVKNIKTLHKITQQDDKNEYPLLFCYLAFITDDINKLDKEKIEHAIDWLDYETIESFPEYEFLLDNLKVINDALDYTEGDTLLLPKTRYINLACANLPQVGLQGQDLRRINFTNTCIEGGNLDATIMDKSTIFLKTNAAKARFTAAEFNDAKLSGNYQCAKFDESKLQNADLADPELDTRNADVSKSFMSKNTRFIANKGYSNTAAYRVYIETKKAMLKQTNFFNAADIKNDESLDSALTKWYFMLIDNKQFRLLQTCLGHNLVMLGQQSPDKPDLNVLGNFAYQHPLFENQDGFAQVANDFVNSVYGLFSQRDRRERDVLESDVQSQLRVALTN